MLFSEYQLPYYPICRCLVSREEVESSHPHPWHRILKLYKQNSESTFKKLIKHEYPIIEMELDDIFTYCEYTKNNILITNYIK